MPLNRDPLERVPLEWAKITKIDDADGVQAEVNGEIYTNRPIVGGGVPAVGQYLPIAHLDARGRRQSILVDVRGAPKRVPDFNSPRLPGIWPYHCAQPYRSHMLHFGASCNPYSLDGVTNPLGDAMPGWATGTTAGLVIGVIDSRPALVVSYLHNEHLPSGQLQLRVRALFEDDGTLVWEQLCGDAYKGAIGFDLGSHLEWDAADGLLVATAWSVDPTGPNKAAWSTVWTLQAEPNPGPLPDTSSHIISQTDEGWPLQSHLTHAFNCLVKGFFWRGDPRNGLTGPQCQATPGSIQTVPGSGPGTGPDPSSARHYDCLIRGWFRSSKQNGFGRPWTLDPATLLALSEGATPILCIPTGALRLVRNQWPIWFPPPADADYDIDPTANPPQFETILARDPALLLMFFSGGELFEGRWLRSLQYVIDARAPATGLRAKSSSATARVNPPMNWPIRSMLEFNINWDDAWVNAWVGFNSGVGFGAAPGTNGCATTPTTVSLCTHVSPSVPGDAWGYACDTFAALTFDCSGDCTTWRGYLPDGPLTSLGISENLENGVVTGTNSLTGDAIWTGDGRLVQLSGPGAGHLQPGAASHIGDAWPMCEPILLPLPLTNRGVDLPIDNTSQWDSPIGGNACGIYMDELGRSYQAIMVPELYLGDDGSRVAYIRRTQRVTHPQAEGYGPGQGPGDFLVCNWTEWDAYSLGHVQICSQTLLQKQDRWGNILWTQDITQRLDYTIPADLLPTDDDHRPTDPVISSYQRGVALNIWQIVPVLSRDLDPGRLDWVPDGAPTEGGYPGYSLAVVLRDYLITDEHLHVDAEPLPVAEVRNGLTGDLWAGQLVDDDNIDPDSGLPTPLIGVRIALVPSILLDADVTVDGVTYMGGMDYRHDPRAVVPTGPAAKGALSNFGATGIRGTAWLACWNPYRDRATGDRWNRITLLYFREPGKCHVKRLELPWGTPGIPGTEAEWDSLAFVDGQAYYVDQFGQVQRVSFS